MIAIVDTEHRPRPDTMGVTYMAAEVMDLFGNTLYIRGRLGNKQFDVEFSDDEMIEAIMRYPTIQDGVRALIYMGYHASKAALTGLEVHSLRNELLHTADEVGDAVGDLADRMERLTEDDGPLALAMRAAVERGAVELLEVLQHQADPSRPGSVASAGEAITQKLVDIVAKTQSDYIEELRRATNQHSATIIAAAHEMHRLDAAGPLGEALGRIEKGLIELSASMAASQARGIERKRGNAKGMEYEDETAQIIASIAVACGDVAEHTGGQQGVMLGSKQHSLRGDVTCTIAPSLLTQPARVVFEVMNRAPKELTVKRLVAELNEAKQNRQAMVAIAVMPSADNPAMVSQPVATFGPGLWAVALPQNGDWNDIPLRTVYTIVRQGIIQQARRGKGPSQVGIRQAVAEINRNLAHVEATKQQLNAIGRCQKQGLESIDQFEKGIRRSITNLMEACAA